MNAPKVRVGIVGLRPGDSWAAVSHLPALRHLHDTFEIAGVANSRLESARAAAEAHDVPRAFGSAAEIAASPDIDLVVVTTRVPQHYEVVKAALDVGKPVYCEWPLGRTLDEAVELAEMARRKGLRAFTGTQARVSPAILQLRQLVAGGRIGDVVATSITGYVGTWGPTIGDLANERYLRERSNGASLLTIPLGHTLAALRDVLGDFADLSAVLETRYREVWSPEIGAFIPADAPDHIVIAARLSNGAPLSLFYVGGTPPDGHGCTWIIRGTKGDLVVTGPHGYTQIAELTVKQRLGDSESLGEIPQESDALQPLGLVSGNVARIYQRIADDLRGGLPSAPTFDDAVRLHRVIHAIEQSAETGNRAILQPAPHQPTKRED